MEDSTTAAAAAAAAAASIKAQGDAELEAGNARNAYRA